MSPLHTQRCIPCTGVEAPLKSQEAQKMRDGETPLWSLNNEVTRIERTFEFSDFREAMQFVNRVADIAESEGHHPDVHIHYNKVRLVLYTHAIGGLHDNDFICASKIDKVLST